MTLSDVGARSIDAPERAAWTRRAHSRTARTRGVKQVVRAVGSILYDVDDRPVLDGAAAFAGAIAGHGRSEIAKAVQDQLNTRSGVAMVSHEILAADFDDWVTDAMPDASAQWIFTESVNDALGAALSAAILWQQTRGEIHRNLVISNDADYGMAISAESTLPGRSANIYLAPPALVRNRFCRGQPEHGADEADAFEQLIASLGKHRVAACVIRPLSVALGVCVPPEGYLERIRAICDSHGVLLCFDETLCSTGRCGAATVASSLNVAPDLLVLGDEWTNGAQPFSALAISDTIWDGLGDAGSRSMYRRAPRLLHPLLCREAQHSTHFGPLAPQWAPTRTSACAAAKAMLALFEREQLLDRAERSSAHFLDALFSLSELPVIADIRGIGLVAGIDLQRREPHRTRTDEIQRQLWRAGLNVASCNDTLMLAPPLCVDAQEIDSMSDILRRVLRNAA
jgi:beta-alanine--pyruvate transaminase